MTELAKPTPHKRASARRNIFALSGPNTPTADLERLVAFKRRVDSGAAGLDASMSGKYALRYRRLLGSLARGAPHLLALAPAQRFGAEAVGVHRDELLTRLAPAGVADELRYLNAALAHILPEADRTIIPEVVAALGDTTRKPEAAAKAERLNLRDDDLDRDYPQLIDKLKAALPIAEGRRVAQLSPDTLKLARQHLCEFLGALQRCAPAMAKATGAALFACPAVAVFVADIESRAPEAAAGRVIGLRLAAMRIDPGADYGWMKTLANELRDRHPAADRPPPDACPQSPALDETLATEADRRMLDRCFDNDSAEAEEQEWRFWGKRRVATMREHYLSYLGAVARAAPGLLAAPLLERFTPEVVELAIADLKSSCDDKTIAERLRNVQRLLQRAFPGLDFDWLGERAHALVRFRRRKTRTLPILPALDLIKTGFAMMEEVLERLALMGDKPSLFGLRPFAERYRDGLMMACLALMAPRLSAFAAWRLGTTFVMRDGAFFYLALDTKNGAIEFKRVPDVLTRYIEVYFRLIRAAIAPHAPPEAIWVSSRGGALSGSGLQKILPRVSLEQVGLRITEHGYRYIVATSAAAFVEIDPTLAAEVLHHLDPAVTDRVYILAGRDSAQRHLADAVDEALAAHLP
jgi:hypothetical protein